MATPTTFGLRFENALRRWGASGPTGRTGNDFAKAIGVSPGLLSQWKTRGDGPPPEQGLRAAKVLGVDPGWLYYGEASGAPAPAWWPDVVAAIEALPKTRGHKRMGEAEERAAKKSAAKGRRRAG